MLRFYKNIILFILITSGIFYLLLNIFRFNELPPIVTVDVNFDSKMLFLREQHLTNADLIVYGSSMSQNLVISDVMKQAIGEHSYLNLSSWSLQISDIKYLLKYFVKKYKPKCIMMASSVTDFCLQTGIEELPKYYELDLLFSKKCDSYFLLKNHQIEVLLERQENLKRIQANPELSKVISFDKYGGIPYDFPKDRMDTLRWNGHITPPKQIQYDALKNLLNLLKEENIKFIFVQCPVNRNNYRKDEDKAILMDFFETTKNIVKSYNQIYINLHNEEIYKDSLFNDAIHLNLETSKFFTWEIVKNINLDSILSASK